MGAVARVKDRVGIGGVLTVEVVDAKTGLVISTERVRNKVTLSGRNLAANILRGAANALSKFAVGTGTTAVADGDTALVNEKVRDTVTSTAQGDNVLTVRYTLGTTQGNGFTMAEAAVLNDVGTLFSRATHAGIAKTSAIQINYTWTYTFSSLT